MEATVLQDLLHQLHVTLDITLIPEVTTLQLIVFPVLLENSAMTEVSESIQFLVPRATTVQHLTNNSLVILAITVPRDQPARPDVQTDHIKISRIRDPASTVQRDSSASTMLFSNPLWIILKIALQVTTVQLRQQTLYDVLKAPSQPKEDSRLHQNVKNVLLENIVMESQLLTLLLGTARLDTSASRELICPIQLMVRLEMYVLLLIIVHLEPTIPSPVPKELMEILLSPGLLITLFASHAQLPTTAHISEEQSSI